MSLKPFSKIQSIKSFVLSQFYKIFLLFGRQTRFTCALRLVKIIEPIAGKFSYYKMPPIVLGTYREYLTAALLNSMTLHDVEFDIVLTVKGKELLIPEGAIFVSGHFYLNFIFMRWLYDIGRQPSIFLRTGTDEWRILGTKIPYEILEHKPVSLNKVKRLVSNDKIVLTAIDSTIPYLHWTKLNVTDSRDIFVNDSLIKLAERTHTPIFFFDTFFDENNNVTAIIERASSNDTQIVLDEFAKFISSALKRRNL